MFFEKKMKIFKNFYLHFKKNVHYVMYKIEKAAEN